MGLGVIYFSSLKISLKLFEGCVCIHEPSSPCLSTVLLTLGLWGPECPDSALLLVLATLGWPHRPGWLQNGHEAVIMANLVSLVPLVSRGAKFTSWGKAWNCHVIASSLSLPPLIIIILTMLRGDLNKQTNKQTWWIFLIRNKSTCDFFGGFYDISG